MGTKPWILIRINPIKKQKRFYANFLKQRISAMMNMALQKYTAQEWECSGSLTFGSWDFKINNKYFILHSIYLCTFLSLWN